MANNQTSGGSKKLIRIEVAPHHGSIVTGTVETPTGITEDQEKDLLEAQARALGGPLAVSYAIADPKTGIAGEKVHLRIMRGPQ